jgi:hypothetical protein
MENTISVEVIGLNDSSCSPFPCNEDRTCGLSDCCPMGTLQPAFDSLKTTLHEEYGDRVSVSLILIDDEIPQFVKEIIEKHYPPLPIILVNRKVTPIGRISLPLIKKEIEKYV